ncbi:hypothetical protein MKW92_033944, partial [Papaver armeniacum]
TTSAAFENCRPGEQFVRSPVTGYQFTTENCAKAQRWCQNECEKAGQSIVFGECSGQHLRGTLMEACCGSPPPPCPEPPIDEGDMTSSLTAPHHSE